MTCYFQREKKKHDKLNLELVGELAARAANRASDNFLHIVGAYIMDQFCFPLLLCQSNQIQKHILSID